MKLTVLLLTAAFFQVHASGVAQSVTLSGKDVPLKQVFAAIKNQTGYVVFGKEDIFKDARPVSLTVYDMPLTDLLELVMKEQPLTYYIDAKTIVLSPKPAVVVSFDRQPNTSVTDVLNSPPAFPVRGVVRNADGEPLSASIVIKGTKTGESAKADGSFTINANQGDVLMISMVGYGKLEIKLTSATTAVVVSSDRQPSYSDSEADGKFRIGSAFVASSDRQFHITLLPSNSKLDEVQVIAYGQTTQRLNTGNVSTVKAADIQKQPVNNPLLALQGRVPGLVITQATGFPGSGVNVLIQGQNSISTGVGNDPLYVIDGIPFTSRLLWTLSRVQGSSGNGPSDQQNLIAGAGNPLSFINPNDIESIDILKDADATAIYGSRAANGAILITTKKGKSGKTKVDINVQSGWGKVTRKLDLLNTQQYLEMRKEAYANAGTPLPVTPANSNYDLTVWDQNRYTDWQKVLIGGTARYHDVQASMSGGNANTQVLVGAGYHKETTVFPGDLSDRKGSLHFSLNNISHNQKFRLSLTGSYLIDDNELNNRDLTIDAIRLAPNAPSLYDDDGSINWAAAPNGNSTWDNPVAYLQKRFSSKVNNLIANVVAQYQLLPGLDLKSSFGYTSLHLDETLINPGVSILPEFRDFTPRSSDFNNNSISSWIIEPQINYKHLIGKGRFELLIGSSIQQNTNKLLITSGWGYNSDLDLKNITAAPFKGAINSESVYKYNSLFGRLNYNWDH